MSVMLPHEVSDCSGIIPQQAIVSVSNSLQCWALKSLMLLISLIASPTQRGDSLSSR